MTGMRSGIIRRLKIVEVAEKSQVEKVAALAREIWTEHYSPIIGEAQVKYMLDNFQTAAAVARQIDKEAYLYYLLADAEDEYVGYLAAIPRPLQQELFLSKIYLKKDKRGRGHARATMRFLERLAAKTKARKISLTVNRGNTGSIAAYEAMGFQKTRKVVTDIGGGFVMDDYVMEKQLPVP